MRTLHLLFTLAIPAMCKAFSQLSISFSIWSPVSMDLALVDAIVAGALRSFLCQEAKITLLDTNYRSMCFERTLPGDNNIFSNVANLSMLDFMKQSDPLRSYLADEISNVLVSDFNQIDRIQGTTWDITYDILQVGSKDVERASIESITDVISYIENRIQRGLNISISEGIMNERLMGTDVTMGKIGEDFVALPGSFSTFGEENVHVESELNNENSFKFSEENIDADPDLNYEQSAEILRYIGFLMLIGSFSSITILTCMGRRYALERERKETAGVDPEYQRGLVTERGVNLMLERGRRESERILSNIRSVKST
mmetsp:Transcript_24695/g.57967  ORF Transcript_24695/g.57967 Transcript_24695/m.57967 type:complete len:314 (-) Transcript_24695:214-1155(-)